MGRIATVCGAAGVLVLLAGCTAGVDGAGPPAPTPDSSHVDTATDRSTPTAPIGTIGSGTFTSDDGVTGTVRFDSDGQLLTLSLHDLVLPRQTQVEAMAAVQPVPAGQTCFDSGPRMNFGPAGAGTSAQDGQELRFVGGDPTAIDQVILTTPYGLAVDGDCLATIVASADIEWTFAPLRPNLRATDSGETGGARGIVETRDGASVAYVVAPGDLIEEVAARLGITVDDIGYLNTVRLPEPQQAVLHDGERLNLLVADR
ncbi:hypothetical protein E3O44_00510 [Cryobacterium algoricola]|uniref:LysM domain-containing protein n=1 Tax=Cryobacterium algoricola TaxID=1259183 RepID=A0ABY2IF09_9MICO|nr:hypothetical protein [Cryobacterium algoricola]TFB90134.1 hypothetical protein E3O44_00510 [Cryobacterium algoricola]